MTPSAGHRSLARAAASAVVTDRWRVVRAGVVLLLVPLTAAVSYLGLLLATLAIDPLHTDLLSHATYRAVTSLVALLAMVVTLSVFASLDALFVATIFADGGFPAGLDRVRENPRGVALWIFAFVVAFWPFRLVVLPQWTMAWVLEALPALSGDFSWLPVPAVARALAIVLLLSAVTLYLAPLTVIDARGPKRALRDNVRLVRVAPVETARAALLGVAAVIAGLLAFGLGLLVLAFSLGLWIFGLLLLPIALPLATLGFVCLAAAYAFARTLVVETYRREQNRLPSDAGAGPANAPADPS